MVDRSYTSDCCSREGESSGRETALRLESSTCSVVTPAGEPDCFERMLTAELSECWQEPMTADELLAVNGQAFEPFFDEPPLGPVPEHLRPHLWVHGCVAEYEEQLEELERWKSERLARLLEERIGRPWRVAGQVFELKAEKGPAASDMFSLRLIEDRTRSPKSTADVGRGRENGR